MASANSRNVPLRQSTSITGSLNNENGNLLVGNSFGQSTLNFNSYSSATDESRRSSRVWFVPREVDTHFTGREDILSQLSEVFHQDKNCTTRQKRFVIAGLGGSGKSEVCLRYAWNNKNRYTKCLWVDCQSQDTAQNSFRQIGQLCGLGSNADGSSVKTYIANLPPSERWLLVIDNADDTERNYGEYFPPADTGDIIITTRDSCLIDEYGTAGGVELDLLDEERAIELLLKNARIPLYQWSDSQEVASSITKELDRHTLALVHAGSFIRERRCKIERYLDLYKAKHDILFKHERRRSPPPYGTLHTTLEVSVQFLKKLKEDEGRQDAMDALDMLGILAFMHYECHLGLMLMQAAQGLGFKSLSQQLPLEYLGKKVRLLCPFAPSATDIEQNLRWSQACMLLGSLSIVKFYDPENLVTSGIAIHPLVHVWAQDRLSISEAGHYWGRAACILDIMSQTPFIAVVAATLHIPSVLHCMRNYRQSCLKEDGWTSERVLCNLAIIASQATKEDLDLDRCLTIIKQRVPWHGNKIQTGYKSHSKEDFTALILLLESGIFDLRGDHTGCMKKLELAAYMAKRSCGPFAHDTLDIQARLSVAYKSCGLLQNAMSLLEGIANTYKAMKNLSRMLSAFQYRSSLLFTSGRVREAQKELELITSIQEIVPGSSDLSFPACHLLSLVYIMVADFDAAYEMHQKVVKTHKKVTQGTGGIDVLQLNMHFGHSILKVQQWDLAVHIFAEAAKEAARILPSSHPIRIQCEEGLVFARKKQSHGDVSLSNTTLSET